MGYVAFPRLSGANCIEESKNGIQIWVTQRGFRHRWVQRRQAHSTDGSTLVRPHRDAHRIEVIRDLDLSLQEPDASGLSNVGRIQRHHFDQRLPGFGYVERVVLLEEELRWMKVQYFGTSSQKTDAAAVNPDQAMLFNEAEVLAAIEAAEEAHRQRTTKVGEHERQHTGGREAIPSPPTLLPRTMASSSLLAQLITSKFDDGIPLYRVSRHGFERGHRRYLGQPDRWG
jgi:hypothetical protein